MIFRDFRENQRPDLDNNITPDDFLSYYWLKKELQEFCRNRGILVSGSKVEISQRIVKYLETGEIITVNENKDQVLSKKKIKDNIETLSLNSIITANYRNSEENRAFFKSIIGSHFHFTTRFMKFCKENVGKTYQDAVNEWLIEYEEKKNGIYKTKISSQFEYNQFICDYFADHKNKGKKLTDAIEEWNKKKAVRGDNKYIKSEDS